VDLCHFTSDDDLAITCSVENLLESRSNSMGRFKEYRRALDSEESFKPSFSIF